MIYETQDSNTKRAVIYCRVSTKEQVEEGNSLVSQERICREYALKEGYEVVEIFIEKGESAKTAKRRELQRLLAFCTTKKGNVNAVIAYKVDRISRNIADYSFIKVRLKKYDVIIKSVTEFFEDTPAGRFMENIIANVGQFDNDVRTERCIGGMREAMNEGRYVWKAPPGYDNAKVNGKSNIVLNNMAPLIKEAFELIALRMYSTEEVRLKVTAKGLTSKKGLTIHRGHFFKLIRNPIYKGLILKFGTKIQGIFEPIVSEELFDDVQAALAGRRHKIKHYIHDNPDFPLRRFVVNEDGKQLTGYWSKGKCKKYPYYSFSLPGTTIRKELVEQKFVEFLSKYTFDTVHLKAIKKHLIKFFGEHANKQRANDEEIKKRITDINDEINKLIKLHDVGGITTNVLKDRVHILDAELEELKEILRSKPKECTSINDLMKFAAKILSSPDALWQKASLEERKRFQVFVFPQGIIYNGIEFRTPQICNIYKAKELIDRYKFFRADLRDGEKNTLYSGVLPPSAKMLLDSKAFWTTVYEELSSFNASYSIDLNSPSS
ncbi:recombinase family protein [Mucilaginibacter sp. AK015]|uniref:recombinase family protein n=1 Tax=Mucilaginibacter sp. AK015 TaxID=2723072 RepID=UPI00160EAF11|nr:recombinase family protein [Mucilaginibacter sp. AK015]MBB5397189.1 DNA invertase Pin-like site-specific DNA recombinase [Mucilaginibacter sp. AK015]